MMKNNFVLAAEILFAFVLLSGFAGAVGITDGTFGGVIGVEQGKTYNTNVMLTNSPNRNNIFSISVGGDVGSWVTLISPLYFNLSAGETKLISLTIFVPDSASKGTHTGTVTATGTEIIGGGTVGYQEAAKGTIYADVIRSPTIASNTTNNNTTAAASNTVSCALELKQCPDGTYTSRNPGDNCSFYPCPTFPVNTSVSPGTTNISGSIATASNVSGAAIPSNISATIIPPNHPYPNTSAKTAGSANNAGASVTATMPQPPAVSANMSIKITGDNKGVLETATVSVDYTGKVKVEGSKIIMNTSDGQKQIILPEDAINASGILDRESIKKIELTEKSNKPVYSVTEIKQAKLFFFIPVSMNLETDVDAETGKIISVSKPWWSFLAGGS